MFNVLMRSTFYGHFVAGEDQNGIRLKVENMMKYGVKSILDYSAEEDLESQKEANKSSATKVESSISTLTGRPYLDPSEVNFDKNAKIFMDCVDAVSDVTNATGLAAVKLTSLIRPDLLLKLSSLISQLKEYNKSSKNHNQMSKNILEWKNLVHSDEAAFAELLNSIAQIKKSNLNFSEKELGEIRHMILRIDKIVEVNKKRNIRRKKLKLNIVIIFFEARN